MLIVCDYLQGNSNLILNLEALRGYKKYIHLIMITFLIIVQLEIGFEMITLTIKLVIPNTNKFK